MILEYRGTEPDPYLSKEMREFVYDDEDWLDTKFYDNLDVIQKFNWSV